MLCFDRSPWWGPPEDPTSECSGLWYAEKHPGAYPWNLPGVSDHTLSLDTAVEFAIDHGASVRLIGDDQQFAAIGAGGILSDIKQTHGALQLTELQSASPTGLSCHRRLECK
jgi:hypothetical protein